MQCSSALQESSFVFLSLVRVYGYFSLLVFSVKTELVVILSKLSKLLNVDVVVVEGLDCCFLFPEKLNTLLSVEVVGCMNG